MFCLHVYVYYMHAVPMAARRGHQTPPENGLADSYKLPCKCWELNLGPQVQYEHLAAELCLQSVLKILKRISLLAEDNTRVTSKSMLSSNKGSSVFKFVNKLSATTVLARWTLSEVTAKSH